MASSNLNFCFPVPPKLENGRRTTKHAKAFIEVCAAILVYNYLASVGPYATTEEFLFTFYDPIVQKDPGYLLFLLIDKTRPASTTVGLEGEEGAVAGHLAYMTSSAPNLTTEIGWIDILPPFQHTHVTSNAVGLMMHYALDLPDRGGLGLRKVVWQANELNKPSRGLAERMGFRFEGILRWDRVVSPHKKEFWNGVEVREGDPRGEEYAGRHSVTLGHCWDDWEQGGREKLDKIMARTA